MNASTPVRFLLAVFAGAAAASLAHAQNFVLLNKQQNFVQTSPTAVAPSTGSQPAFEFSASIEGTATNPAPPNTVTVPSGGGTRTLAFAGDEWEFVQSFPSLAALATAYPNGTYQMTFGGRNLSVPFNGDLYPTAPVATITGGTFTNGNLVVDRASQLVITAAFTGNYLAGSSHLGIDLSGGSGSGPFQEFGVSNSEDPTPFTRTPLTLTIPPNTLMAGGSYTLQIDNNRIVTLDTSSAGFFVVAAYSSVTRINVVVGGGTGIPVFVAQPSSQTVAPGSTVVFNAIVNGATNLQWRLNGQPLPGQNSPTLILSGAAVVAGNYSLQATNGPAGAVSSPAVLTVSNTTDVGKLINLSILTSIGSPGDNFTLGYVVGGAGTTGSKPLVIRAAGPALGALGVGGTLADPRMELFAGSTSTLVNDNWGGSAAVTTAMASVGAFAYTNPTSLDAAVVANITTRDNSVRVNANGTGTGQVIAEVYDATAAGTFTATTPRLLNVSVLKNIPTGGSMTAGFVLRGQTSRTVLIRAIGPGLGAAFGIPGFMPDPQLTLFGAGGATVAVNDNWNGNGAVTFAANSVGAFAVTDGGSRDSMLVLTLPPGDYSARVAGAGGVGGQVIIEVYEVP
jgi:hypothetical protein